MVQPEGGMRVTVSFMRGEQPAAAAELFGCGAHRWYPVHVCGVIEQLLFENTLTEHSVSGHSHAVPVT